MAFIVRSPAGERVAAFYVEGWSGFQLLEVHYAGWEVETEPIEAALLATLVAEPARLGVCEVVVLDPEPRRTFPFGWDGRRFLGRAEAR